MGNGYMIGPELAIMLLSMVLLGCLLAMPFAYATIALEKAFTKMKATHVWVARAMVFLATVGLSVLLLLVCYVLAIGWCSILCL